jgi:hypothetical protein
MWNNDKLSYVLANAKYIVGGDKVQYVDEVEHRLLQALESRPVVEHKKMPALNTPSQKRRRKEYIFGSPSNALEHFVVKPYHCTETGTAPTSHLDISRAAMAFTAPLTGFVAPFTGGTKFEVMSILQLEEFLSKPITATDGDTISELAGTVLTKNDAVQLYRNFVDCEKVEYMLTKGFIHFTQREHDIIAFAVLQIREKRSLPDFGAKQSLVSVWGGLASVLIPYRHRKNFIDKFYVRQHLKNNLVDKLESSLANDEYREHLEKRVAPLFDFVISKK